MRKIILIVLLLFIGGNLQAQTNLDSLYSVWQDESQQDSLRTNAYYEYVLRGFTYSNPDTALVLAEALMEYGEKHNYTVASAYAYNLMGYSHGLLSGYNQSLVYYKTSLDLFESMGHKRGMATSLVSVANSYAFSGYYPKALDYYKQGLKLSEEINDYEIMSKAIGNIAWIYSLQKDNNKALEYTHRGLKIAEKSGNKNMIAGHIGNIGSFHQEQGNYSKAMEYYQRSLKILQEIGNTLYESRAIYQIGDLYRIKGDLVKALQYYQSSLEIRTRLGNKSGIAESLAGIGTTYQKQGESVKAINYCKQSLSLAKDIKELVTQKTACQCLYEAHKALGNGNEALVYMDEMRVIEDSLNVLETNKKLQQMEFAKQVMTDSLAHVEKERLAEEAHREEVRQKEKTRNIGFGIGTFFLLLSGGLYRRWRYIKKSKATLQVEKDRSENLLLNILPAEIAAELKEKGKADARDYDVVSILFTDFKEFTQTSEKLSAQELVSEINTCFEAFDAICSKHKVEKIKTIGDAYMAAGGLPVPSNDSVKNTVLAALEMQHFISERKKENNAQGKSAFEMRVGMHTGPVVAGIVGVKKFQYDIWGDTVNTASRMENLGEAGKVNISKSTYDLIKDDPDFSFEQRGHIEAKGKGEMEMYFVSRK